MVKNLPPANAGDTGSTPGLGRSPGGGNGNPLQYSCLRNPRQEGWRATVHGVANSQTRMSTHTLLRVSKDAEAFASYLSRGDGGNDHHQTLHTK